jgi:hypothetical protein
VLTLKSSQRLRYICIAISTVSLVKFDNIGVSERVLAVIILLDTFLNFLITHGTKGTSSHQNPLTYNCGSEKSRFWRTTTTVHLLGARVLGDGLRSLADGMFGQFSRKQQANGRLDFAARDRRTSVVVSEAGSFGGDTLEDVVNEAVHDGHRLAADTSVGMHLLQHLVDVDGVALPSPPLLLLVASAHGLSFASRLLRSLTRWFRWHCCFFDRSCK